MVTSPGDTSAQRGTPAGGFTCPGWGSKETLAPSAVGVGRLWTSQQWNLDWTACPVNVALGPEPC